jgi:hypothetical protein
MRRRGGPKRKDGPRKPSGRLRHVPSVDPGHDETLAKRADLVGDARCRDPRAGYPLGVLLLRGLLSDPALDGEAAADQARQRHDAGLRYAADHELTYGSGGRAKSHLAGIIDGIRRQAAAADQPESKAIRDAHTRLGRKIALVRLLPPPHTPYPHHILDRIAVDEAFDLSPAELDALRRALHALVGYRPPERHP